MKRFYSARELSEMYGISINTVRKYFDHAKVRIGRCVRYDIEMIQREELNADT